MEPIKITNDYQEKLSIGKSIFDSHPEIYSHSTLDYMLSNLAVYLPEASEEEKHNAFLHSIYDYWVYGNDLQEEFIYDFPHKSHEEKSQYITLRSKLQYFRYLNDKEEEKIFADKYRTYQLFQEEFQRDVILLSGEEDYEKFLHFIEQHSEFFVKPYSLALGMGIYKENAANWDDKKALFHHLLQQGRTGKEFNWSLGCKVVLEEVVKQEKTMAALHPSSVNVVRIATVLVNEKPEIAFCCVRIGIKGGDAASDQAGEITCGIDAESGVIDSDGVSDYCEMFECHPDTGIRLKGFQIPRWSEALELAKKIAHRVPTVRYVGWDLALTDRGWVIIEGNEHGDFISQIAYARPFRKEFEHLIGYRLGDRFWWE